MNFSERELKILLYLVDKLNKRIEVLKNKLKDPESATPPLIAPSSCLEASNKDRIPEYKDETVRFVDKSYDTPAFSSEKEKPEPTIEENKEVFESTDIPEIEKIKIKSVSSSSANASSDLSSPDTNVKESPSEPNPDVNMQSDENFMQLAKHMVEVIELFDSMDASLSEEQKEIAISLKDNIINGLIMGGCQPIEAEKYDVSLHKLNPFKNIPLGSPISSVIREGVKYNNNILLRAIVTV